MAEFIQYQTFLTPGAAQPLLTLLHQQKIPFETSTDQHIFDPAFADNTTRTQFTVELRQQGFQTAQVLETAFNEQAATEIEPDHYLFSVNDGELFDILAKPDE
jgi:hypothetical protein